MWKVKFFKTASCSVTVTAKDDGKTPGQKYYEEKYPGKNVVIVDEGGGALLGTDGDDVLVGGEGDDWLEGGEGDDIYVYNPGGGHDVISNVSGGEGQRDELHFGPGIASDDLGFAREDDDLVITVLDKDGIETGSVTVEDWYLSDDNKLSKIVFDDGSELSAVS